MRLMTKQITLEEAQKLVRFKYDDYLGWQVCDVNGNIKGDVNGNIKGNVYGNVNGNVGGYINSRKWEFVETPKEKLQRLITESGSQELIDTFNQMENN
jgi:hypothetical protein